MSELIKKEFYILIDCNRIQDYVFASYRLKEICGASAQIADLEKTKMPTLANHYQGEIVRSGGGVVIAVFDDTEKRAFFEIEACKQYRDIGISVTSETLDRACGLADFNRDVLRPLFSKIVAKKVQPHSPEIAVSTILSVPCESSGDSAAEKAVFLPEGKIGRYSAAAAKKFSYAFRSRADRNGPVPKTSLEEYCDYYGIPDDFDELVSWGKGVDASGHGSGTSEKRLMGIVYADVNGLGRITENIGRKRDIYEYFAPELTRSLEKSLFEAILCVINPHIVNGRKCKKLPFRLLYMGGDDLALAVQGCFVLDLAAALVSKFEDNSRELMQPESTIKTAGGRLKPG